MPEETIWTLGADGEDVLSILDEIESGVMAMGDSIDAAVSGMDESFSALTASMDTISQMTADGAAAFNDLDDALAATTDAATSTTDALTNLQSANDAMSQTLSEDNQIISGLNEQITNLTAQLDVLATSEADAAAGAAGLEGELAPLEPEVLSLGEAIDAAMGPLMMLGTVAIMAGAKFVSMGMDGQKGEALLRGMAGASQQDINMLQQSAMELGLSMTDATAGFYQVESAGYSGTAAIQVFTAATKLSEGGQASAADTMSALTAIMHDYSAKASDSTHYTDLMATAVVRGKQSMQDFATSIGPLASAGENVGLSFQQVAAAEATMTQINPSVMRDSMQLTGLFQSLDPAIGGVAGKAKKLKLSFDEAHYSSLDLLGKLQYLAEISGGTDTAAFVKLTGGVRGSTAAIDLLKGGAASFKGNLQAMGHATGATATAFASFENTVPAHLAKVGAALSVFATRFMDAIGPTVIPLIDGFTSAIGAFASFISQHMDIVMPILVALAAIIGVLLVLAVVAFMGPLLELIATFTPFIIAIAAVAAGAVLLAQHWNQVVAALHLTGPMQALGGFFHNLAGSVSTAFGAMSRSADEQTLRMKLTTITHTQQMAQGNIANITQQERGIEDELRKTINASTRHMLEMKLKALETSKAQADGVIKNMQHEREGVQQQLDLMNPATHLKDLQRTSSTINATIEGTTRTIQGYSMMRAGIEAQLTQTTNAVKRHALEMQLAQITAAQKQKEGVLKALEGQRSGVEKQMGQLHNQVNAENSNWILKTIGFFQNLGSSIAQGFGQAVKAVMPFLQQIGAFVQAQFLPVWQQLVTMWQTQLMPLFAQLWGAIQPLLPVLGMLAALVGGVLAVALGLAVGVIDSIIKGLAGFLSGLIIVIGGIVQFFTGTFQVFSGLLSFFVDLFTGHFNKLGADLGMIWQGVINMFKGGWTAIAGVFQTAWFTVSGIVSGFVQGVIGFFTTLWDELVGHSIVPDMINGIINFFLQLPGKVVQLVEQFVTNAVSNFTNLASRVISSVTGLISNITSIFTGLASSALTWGGDMINGFISGIKNAAGGIGNVVGGIASHIASFLHFSKPDQGPLADADKFMPDMMDMFTRDIVAGTSKLKQAVSGVAKEMSSGLSPQGASGAGIGASGGIGSSAHTALLQQMVHLLQQQGRGQQSGLGPVPPSFSQSNSFNISGGGLSGANMQELYQILNQLAGQANEFSGRGTV